MVALLSSGITVMVHASGGSGYALQFDGSDDYVQIPDISTLEPAAVTVETWVKVSAFTSSGVSGYQYIIFKKNSRVNDFEGYTLWLDNSTKRFFSTVTSAGGVQRGISGTSDANLDQWYHLALLADSTQTSLYIDGELQGTVTTGFALDYGDTPLYFGRTGEGWDG